MDINQHVESIVENLVRGIESRLEARLEKTVTDFLDNKLATYDFDKKIQWLASVKLDGLIASLEIDREGVENRIQSVTDVMIQSIDADCRRAALDRVRSHLNSEIDVTKVVRETVASEITRKIDVIDFPERSIPGTAVDITTLELTGNHIKGGIIQNFGSTGIDDRSSQVQMTILDQGVVVENKMVTLGLEVKGTTVLDGDLVLNGEVKQDSPFYVSIIDNAVKGVKDSMDQSFFGDYSTVIFDKIREEGLDLTRITLNGTEIITGNKLNYGIVDTNITRLGLVKDLQSTGETFLSEHLYVGKNKVGIGTMEPGHSLTVWDQEVEVAMGKRLKDTGWIGTPRNQSLIISANNKDNLTLGADGSVTVHNLTVNRVKLMSISQVPSTAEPKGTVAFNENPDIGKPIGWVSLGGGAWCKFGVVS